MRTIESVLSVEDRESKRIWRLSSHVVKARHSVRVELFGIENIRMFNAGQENKMVLETLEDFLS